MRLRGVGGQQVIADRFGLKHRGARVLIDQVRDLYLAGALEQFGPCPSLTGILGKKVVRRAGGPRSCQLALPVLRSR